jgi:hypothetical protein
MKTPIEELGELMHIGGGERSVAVTKYSRRQPIHIERAVSLAAALDLLNRLEVGKSITVSHTVANTIKFASKKVPGAKLKSKTIDQNNTSLTRIS